MEEYELDAVIDSLASVRGGGTWHISLYVRPDKSINSVKNRITQEVSEAESIKSDETRDRVQSALGKIADTLDRYDETPDHGIAVFASPQDVHVLDELPFDVPENLYHCGKEFVTDPLTAAHDSGGTYGLIVVERGRATIGVLNAGRIESTIEKSSNVMGKSKAGGQSAARFERVREKQKHNFYKNVQETAYGVFSGYDLDGVVIGGTLSSAKEFADSYTNHEWNVIGTYSVDHGDAQGLSELVERAADEILDADSRSTRDAVESFLSGIRDDSSAYGEGEVEAYLTRGQVETLLLSDRQFSVDEIKKWSQRAEQYGSSVEVVSPTFEDAEMFEEISGGVGAVLRW